MILQRLCAYFDRLLGEGAVQPHGFQTKAIPWVVELDGDGAFVSLRPTGGEDDRGRRFPVPAEVKRSVNIAANLLWDNPEYVFGAPRATANDKQLAKVPKRHAAFVERLDGLPEKTRADAGLVAVRAFLGRGDFSALETAEGWRDMVDGGANVTFKLAGEGQLICERPAVRAAIEAGADESTTDDEGNSWCLITGRRSPAATLHPSVKGVRGAQTSGANLVSFNLDAFRSHGWEQGANAPVDAAAANAYVAALNHLLDRDNRRHRLVEGDTTFVFWAGAPTPMEDRFIHLLGGLGDEPETSDGTEVRAAFDSMTNGLRSHLDDETPFHVLGLAPNAARLAVRLWHEGTVSEMAGRIQQHFDDLSVDGLWRKGQVPGLWRLLGGAAIGGDVKKLQDQLRGKLAAGVVTAILGNRPYPATLLARTVERCRAEQSVWPVRAALVKAALNRRTRTLASSEKEMTVSLDPQNINPGYRLGRLFAVLEGIQRSANPNINTTIRDRYFGAATTTPRAVFIELMRLKNAHLKKLRRSEPGYAVRYEKLVDGITEGLTAEVGFPAFLSLDDQGRFILGYHHQTHDLYTKKTTDLEA
jgi:CRISPR-associated protein Csd1